MNSIKKWFQPIKLELHKKFNESSDLSQYIAVMEKKYLDEYGGNLQFVICAENYQMLRFLNEYHIKDIIEQHKEVNLITVAITTVMTTTDMCEIEQNPTKSILPMVKFLYDELELKGNAKTVATAALHGDLTILKYLCEKMKLKGDSNAINAAVWNNNMPMIEYLGVEQKIKGTNETIIFSVINCNWAIFKYCFDVLKLRGTNTFFRTVFSIIRQLISFMDKTGEK